MSNCCNKGALKNLRVFFKYNGKSKAKQHFATKSTYNENTEPALSWSLKKLYESFKGSLSNKKCRQANIRKEGAAQSVITTFSQPPCVRSFGEVDSSEEQVRRDQTDVTSNCSAKTGDTHEKDIVPLQQFLRYSMDRSGRRTFQRRRLARPFEPTYEIEWQKNQWLQLDRSTNKEIEQLRCSGFTRIAIRKDACLKKHIMYDNPSDIDVLLELSLYPNHSKCTNQVNKSPEPIVCHQPSTFSVRRTQWWHTEYEIGEAHLPNWVDPDLCCKAVIMDAPSVLLAMTAYSRTSLSSIQQLKMPDTPTLSQKSSIMHLEQPGKPFPLNSLQYTEPPILALDNHS